MEDSISQGVTENTTAVVTTLQTTQASAVSGAALSSPSLISNPHPAMPAPKTQAPPRPRRAPAVDPSTLIPTRRSSTRSIKRKKFDDELVESSLVKTERTPRGNVRSERASSSSSTPVVSPSPIPHTTTPAPPIESTASPVTAAAATLMVDANVGGGVSDTPAALGIKGGASSVLGSAVITSPVLSAASPKLTSAAVVTGVSSLVSLARTGKDSHPRSEQPSSRHHSTSSSSTTTHHTAAAAAAKPPSEKRSRPSSGKSTSAAKGGTVAAKSSAAKQVSSAAPPVGLAPRPATSRATASKSKSRVSSKSKSKKSKKQKAVAPAFKDLGRWKPHDDLALITAVQQTNDLSVVHTGVKFSCRFTLREIEERWYALLYDPAISKVAMEAARQLHHDTVATIQGKALYSNAEEKLLGTIASSSQPTVDSFQSLLQQHPDVFHPARTAKTLHSHWMLMKQYHLLPDQTVQPMPKGDHILNLSDIEDFMNDNELGEGEDEMVEQEMALVDRHNKREIRHLEQELPRWQVLVDSVTGISMPDFDSQTLGVLRGRLVRYLMRSREISLGRSTKDNHVDVDLSLEGPAWKVSRRQGIIKLRNSGDFFIANEGKRPIMVDGKPVMCGNKQKLNNNSVVEISCLRFTFLINQDVINAIRADNTKPGSSSVVNAT